MIRTLYPVDGEDIPNKFHLTIYTTNKVVYTILKHLKEMYKLHYGKRLEVKHTSSLDKIGLSFNAKTKKRNETMFCDGEFTISPVAKSKCDTMIVLSNSLVANASSEKDIAGFALLKTFVANAYVSEKRAVNWIAFEVEYLCSHDYLAYVGKTIMNVIKLFCITINYFHSQKTGFILYGITKKKTADFYDRMKVLPDEPVDGNLQRRSWHIYDEPDFANIIETDNIRLVKNNATPVEQHFTLKEEPDILHRENSSKSGNSFWQSSTASSTKRRSQIIKEIGKLEKIPFHQRTSKQSAQLKRIRNMFASRALKKQMAKDGLQPKEYSAKEMRNILIEFYRKENKMKGDNVGDMVTRRFETFIRNKIKKSKELNISELMEFYRFNNFERYINLVKDYYNTPNPLPQYALFWLFLDEQGETYDKEVFQSYFQLPYGDFKTFQTSKEEFISKVLERYVQQTTSQDTKTLNSFLDKHDYEKKYYDKSELRKFGLILLDLLDLIDEYDENGRGKFKEYFERNAEDELGELDYSDIIRIYRNVVQLPS
jgi:hypothetical protein